MAEQNYQERELLDSLSGFLEQFQLPGEGQKVSRILEAFSLKYSADNPSMSEEACHQISYLLMMLHTYIHNTNVSDKMTLPQF